MIDWLVYFSLGTCLGGIIGALKIKSRKLFHDWTMLLVLMLFLLGLLG